MGSHLPAPREQFKAVTEHRATDSSGTAEDGLRVRDVWGLLRRNRWVVLGVTCAVTLAAGAYVYWATPIYEAATTLRIEAKEANLPGIFRSLDPSAGGVVTEVEVLKSRTLAEDAISELGLQLSVDKPRAVKRSRFLPSVTIAPETPPGKYLVEFESQGVYALRGENGTLLAEARTGQPLEWRGMVLAPTTEIRLRGPVAFTVQSLEATRERVIQSIEVSIPNRDARIAVVGYRDTDPELVYQVPNTIATRFIERRQENQSSQARSTVGFLRRQLDTLTMQLSRSEDELRRFRERENVVDPQVEATAQVTRYVTLQAERSSVETERAALAQLLAQVDTTAKAAPGDASPYRRLLGFPTFLRNQGATDLMRALVTVEDERAQLLGRRTYDDPDVQTRTQRIHDLEEQLRLTVTTYLGGLSNQRASIDSTLSQYTQQLSTVPSRQLEFARLQRQPKVLEEMYALLQTRLKEAEISEAVEDVSIRVVDPAVEPLLPVSPRKAITVLGGLVVGLLLGVAAAFLRELMDRSIHTRTDVRVATGLPVLGLIPKIPSRGKHAIIVARTPRARAKVIKPAQTPRTPPSPSRPTYTFLPGPEPEEQRAEAVPLNVHQISEVFDSTAHVTIVGTGTAVTEAYGSLQTNLLYARRESPMRTVVFTSATPGEGKTTNAVNLALTLAQRGVKVVLIDADVRRGVIHQLFDARREPGLIEVLNGSAKLSQALHSVQVEEGGVLRILTGGKVPPNPIAMLESPAMKRLLTELREEYEAVILDAPPVNMLTDAAVLAAHADGVVIVVRAGVTQSGALEYAMHQLQLVQAPLVGVVLNDIDFERDAAYDSAYHYYQYGGTATGA